MKLFLTFLLGTTALLHATPFDTRITVRNASDQNITKVLGDPAADRFLKFNNTSNDLEWATVTSFDSTTVDATTWSDGANASNLWTFDVSGTDSTILFGNNNWVFGVGSFDLGAAGVRFAQDGDSTLTLTGLGNGFDEALEFDFDNSNNNVEVTTPTSAALDLSNLVLKKGADTGTEGNPLHVTYTAVGSGTAYTMTASYATVDMGTTDPTITIASTGTYRIYANIQVNYAGASYVAFDQAAFKLRRTNNTAADLADGERGCCLPIMTTITMLGDTVVIGPLEYTTANTDDVIVVQGDLNLTPSAGAITVTKCSIYAERVRQ